MSKKKTAALSLSEPILEALEQKKKAEVRPSVSNAAEATLAKELIQQGYLDKNWQLAETA